MKLRNTLAALAVAAIATLPGTLLVHADSRAASGPASGQEPPELLYLKQVNAWRPPSDPQLLFLLMGQYANSGRALEGAEYIGSLLDRYRGGLSPQQQSAYLLAGAALRAAAADQVPLLKRIGWVRDTLAMIDQVKELTAGNSFPARWMSGVVRTQVPAFLGERDGGLEDLRWAEAHADLAPHPGWLREVYAGLATQYRARGQLDDAQRYQRMSGLPEGPRSVRFTTPFGEGTTTGHTFSSRRISEVVPGTVYALSGFEFTEYYFIVSANGRELIAIDAGARPDAARQAHEALRARVPSLPPLTTVLITHAHWDHVGGQRYFRGLESAPRFFGRSNYRDELARDAMAHRTALTPFFGQSFNADDVASYRPDVAIDRPTDLVVGGTRIELIPTQGGETDDAMLIRLPEHGVLFVGDILMPYVGAPFAEEGSVDGMLAAIAQVHALAPRKLLHGHEPLTQVFSSTSMLDDLAPHIAWLRDQVIEAIRNGTERGAIHAANLIPPALERSPSNVHLAYLVLRENLINRVFDQQSGYWQNGLHGLDALTDADRGDALVAYLGLDAGQIAAAAERMIADGRHELAAQTLRSVNARFGADPRVQAARRLAYLKLMEKYQEFNPFKVILYSAEIDQALPQINAERELSAATKR
ncbi:MAG TPA: MBL fold metallo-hydrolase [Burkholderiaceae bacterium]|nr:MBL fold metallo-hydrolase [Burkholderiaceae bacterium]